MKEKEESIYHIRTPKTIFKKQMRVMVGQVKGMYISNCHYLYAHVEDKMEWS